ncbi:tannase/feruloyl esterase family alpha/beta hydrolase [Ramlibacter sp. AW1]|uniref:Tannase/feruloyl esterase family alpha/beta hydrolase n=1 Tax=Ramlibacter aurantiacus TaxID=2801330 RepID=A0A936ZSS4_9BURK|nr:tannase/feruloyl esterase family alpha/beta hydrolase [Ramlibacter aurantiacus]MBL0423031.1 tannase/feruloyl esterase family alpha/beta hydrolase [Ramlibacter aurantiacus]
MRKLLAAIALLGSSMGAAHAQLPPPGGTCTNMGAITVPGAEKQDAICLADLSTRYLVAMNRTDASDWGALHSQQTRNPAGAVPGIQIDGYFPDTSTSNGYFGWFHDAQFVIRLPDHWNGKLVITGAPGVRRQYANDYLLSDWFVARGYAYASTDKGNNGTNFQNDGAAPGDAIAEWHRRVTELTLAAKDVVRQRYGKAPAYTYMTGLSNGGYLTRYALENHPELYDGGVDWEGVLWRPEGPNLFTYLPTALRSYPAYKAGDGGAHEAILSAGFAPGSEFLWDHHYGVYWDLTQRTYREEIDPAYDGALNAGIPFCASGVPSCDADYDYASRPPEVRDAVAKISLTGRIGKPMITLHGTLDALLPIATNSDHYAQMVKKAGRGQWHRYYVVEAGNHVDQLYDLFPDQLRPISPCYRSAFLALEQWVESKGQRQPPPDKLLPREGNDLANACPL